MAFNLLNKDIETLSSPALVVFSKASSQKDKPAKVTHSELNKTLADAIADKAITGGHQEAVTFRELNYKGFRHVIVVGLGKENALTHESTRQAVASAFEAIKALKVKEAVLHFDGITANKKEAASLAKATAEGLILTSYVFNELMSAKKEEKEIDVHVVTKLAADKAFKAAFQEGVILATCTNFSRRLGDLPGNLMTPTILADSAVEAAKGTGIKMTVWDKARIKKEKMGGLLGVSQGSDQEPRFIIMEYKGAAASKKPVVFVGKGLTFDCGGISIKPSAGMEEMKYDMCGGANVIGTVLAIAKLKLKINVVGLIASTENLAGPSATKPGDVHTARNGKTFEVNNTDAEGRLILADALSYATELDPQVIIDAATLTGAMVVALGNTHTGYFTRNGALKTKVEKAAQASGEWVWNMPLTDFHVKDMKGTFADLSNISAGKGAGSATAAAFLEQFVGEGIPWAHFDIAGTGWAVGNRLPYCPKKGASGAMIRTFVEIAKLHG
ncbi:leucyl aminopeptidase [Bdellovibrio reynosensis]|uniref:Probable cytosol aminopeptidase n=1 Tax=Bdellovibrio reynosensis TaxID=2835041 RepID=A0ABY4CEC6_9BACT|nr:leucyl aminopeptidase [Bdellovibrio reynosensis]UOF00565.1 leucyl aminopeptidase [Bdellovibrio reynosensis]